MNDSSIIRLFWERSERALSECAAKYGAYCRSIAQRILNKFDESEECLNDTWLRAWNSIPPKKPDLLSVFLGKITRNLALSRVQSDTALKRGGGELTLALEELEECISSAESAESRLERSELSALIRRFLDAQKPANRRVFLQRYWYLCPIKEIAAEYGLSESAVKMRLHRAREELRELLESEGYEI